MTPTFITVLVEEHDELPEGCCMRFKLVTEPRPIHRVRYESEGSPSGEIWVVESPSTDGTTGAAWGATVEDSGAGSCTLIYGGGLGLRLRPAGGGEAIAEPYLLLAHEAVIEGVTR